MNQEAAHGVEAEIGRDKAQPQGRSGRGGWHAVAAVIPGRGEAIVPLGVQRGQAGRRDPGRYCSHNNTLLKARMKPGESCKACR